MMNVEKPLLPDLEHALLMSARRTHPHRPRKRRRIAVVTGIAVLGTAGVAAAAGTGLLDIRAFTPYDRPIATVVEDAQTEGFAIFDRPRQTGDGLSDDARSQVVSSRTSGSNVDLSRAVTTPTGTGWVIPGRDAMCTVLPDKANGYGISCMNTDFALTHGLLGFTSPAAETGPITVSATWLIPRGAEASVTFRNGTSRQLTPNADGVITGHFTDVRTFNLKTSTGITTLEGPNPAPGPEFQDCGDGKVVKAAAQCK